jgi:hypothetical protein
MQVVEEVQGVVFQHVVQVVQVEAEQEVFQLQEHQEQLIQVEVEVEV